MQYSQFNWYSSSDAGGPGLLQGTVGDLIRVWRACLVNGYPGFPAAGWDEPVAAASNCAGFRLGVGSSRCVLFVNDNGVSTGGAREARVTGWETLTGVTGVGVGSGQFPLPAQENTTGHMYVRKSSTADTVGRPWIMAADKYGMHFFVITLDGAISNYWPITFGDIAASYASDSKRCLLITHPVENCSIWYQSAAYAMQTASLGTVVGHYMPRPYSGSGTSTKVGKLANPGFTMDVGNNTYLGCDGISGVNGPDNALWMSPIWIVDGNQIRGKWRGIYTLLHKYVNFSEGQVFEGTGDYVGRTFRVVKPIGNASASLFSCLAIETSATVETN